MADRYWIGINNDFHDAVNWSTVEGGAGGASVPVSGDKAIFYGEGTPETYISVETLGVDYCCSNDSFVQTLFLKGFT